MNLLGILLPVVVSGGQQTPPVLPNVTPVPVPTAVQLPSASEAPAIDPISADDAAKIALQKSPLLGLAKAQIISSHGKSLEAKSGLLPTASASGTYTDLNNLNVPPKGVSAGSTSTGYSTAVTLKQLIFDFNHTKDTVRQASALESAARKNYTRAQSDLTLQVKQAFYSFTQNQALVAVQEANVTDRQAQLALAQARLNVGSGAPADVARAATALADSVQLLLQARNAALASRISLALTMGIDPRTPLIAATSSETTPEGDSNALALVAIKQRPEILQAKETLRAAGYEERAAKTTNAPNLSASLAFGSHGPEDPLASQNGTLSVTLGWTFADAGFTLGKKREAQADILTAQSNLIQAQISAISDVSTAWAALQSAQQRSVVAASEVINAQENLRIAEGRFKGELGTFLDVTDAQASLVTAQTNAVNAKSAVEQAKAVLRHAVGLM